eukprot:15458893-Alexandrium_andersonii.AAC.2
MERRLHHCASAPWLKRQLEKARAAGYSHIHTFKIDNFICHINVRPTLGTGAEGMSNYDIHSPRLMSAMTGPIIG